MHEVALAPVHFVIDTLRRQESHNAQMDGNKKQDWEILFTSWMDGKWDDMRAAGCYTHAYKPGLCPSRRNRRATSRMSRLAYDKTTAVDRNIQGLSKPIDSYRQLLS
jgi:hypothetical protein